MTLMNVLQQDSQLKAMQTGYTQVPIALEKNLGKHSAALYRKSLSSRNVGYGLGALGYMRRVVEDKTNELIEVVAKFAEVEGADPKQVEEIRQAAKSGDG